MKESIDRGANQLLGALLPHASGDWREDLELVDLPLGFVLHEPYVTRKDVYFPVTAVISLLHVLSNGDMAEIAVVGNEGVVGLSLFIGDNISPSCAVVQCAGTAIRVNAALLKQEFVQKGQVSLLLLRFSQALIAQMAQTAVCNRHHPVDQHLCRWILLMLDRHEGNEIAMTQELIAAMLGVRRASVSTAAAALQQEGLITYRRGHITVNNRAAMERRVCECYAVVKAEYDRLLPKQDETDHADDPLRMRTDERRLAFLRQYGILDTPAEPVYDDIARRASHLLEVPIAMVNFMDERRDWFKARVGFGATESPAETSFCNVFFTTDQDTVVIENTLEDRRFSTHPAVRGMPFIRFYAAARLAADGHTLGTLCVYDSTQRRLDNAQIGALKSLAAEALNALKASGRRRSDQGR